MRILWTLHVPTNDTNYIFKALWLVHVYLSVQLIMQESIFPLHLPQFLILLAANSSGAHTIVIFANGLNILS